MRGPAMVIDVLLNVSLAEAVSAPWLALGGILVALREFWLGLRKRVQA